MDAIKAKLTAMREQLAAAEKREEMARIQTRAAKERVAQAKDAAGALKRKIRMAEQALQTVEYQTDLKLDKLERVHKHIYENETLRRQLERKEMKEDNTLEHLESRQKSRRILAEEAEQRYREAYNKMSMLKLQTAKADAKIRAAKSNERYFEGKLNDAGRTANSLARSGEFKEAKCDEYQEKCRRLNDKKKQVLITTECLERKATQMEDRVRSLRAETKETKRFQLEVKRELRDMMDELNTYP